MRVLILGGTGMLGHKLYQSLGGAFEPLVTVRSEPQALRRFGFYCPDQVVPGVDALDASTLERALDKAKPDAVVNCIGIVKQHPLAKDPVVCSAVNATFPHRAAKACAERGVRFVHVSTDCVFDGKKGNYTEGDFTNATDLYGRTKAEGEVTKAPALTLRTSIIGRELFNGTGLVEWFLSHRGGTVKGYANAVFSGLTTLELARAIAKVLREHPTLSGLYQVASGPINKNDLLGVLNNAFKVRATIERDEAVCVDRSLDGSAFYAATGYEAPEWREMAAEMASDPTPYDNWKTL